MNDLVTEISSKSKMLDKAIEKLSQTGKTFAESERDYKMAVTKKALELKDQGTPATLIQTIIYGIDEVARLRFARDIAEVTYNANLEYINSQKLQLRLLDGQLQREWGNAK